VSFSDGSRALALSLTFEFRILVLHRNLQRFRGGLVFKAHRLLYHSTLGLRVIKMKKKIWYRVLGSGFRVQDLGFDVQD